MPNAIEVRIYNRDADIDLHRHECHGYTYQGYTERLECGNRNSTRLTLYAGKPVDFGKLPIKPLLPFSQNRYESFDTLAADMLAAGYLITDYRKMDGHLDDYREIAPLLEDHHIETYKGQRILIKRDANGAHDTLWAISRDLMWDLERSRLVKLDRFNKYVRYSRRVHVAGQFSLETLPEQKLDWLEHSRIAAINEAARREQQRIDEEARKEAEAHKAHAPVPTTPSYVMESWGPGRIKAPAFQKHRAQPRSPDEILGHDHQNNPITFKEVLQEGRRTPPRGLPKDLTPDAPDDCSDEQWEHLMLVEQIKFRRLAEQR